MILLDSYYCDLSVLPSMKLNFRSWQCWSYAKSSGFTKMWLYKVIWLDYIPLDCRNLYYVIQTLIIPHWAGEVIQELGFDSTGILEAIVTGSVGRMKIQVHVSLLPIIDHVARIHVLDSHANWVMRRMALRRDLLLSSTYVLLIIQEWHAFSWTVTTFHRHSVFCSTSVFLHTTAFQHFNEGSSKMRVTAWNTFL